MYRAPGSPEWMEHVVELLRAEQGDPLRWFYMSFVDDNQHLGVCHVRARGPHSAMLESHRLKINPGGQVMTIDMGDIVPPPNVPVNCLLSRAEMEALDGAGLTVGELAEKGLLPGPATTFTE